ncbi:MAG TPA: type 4a pilus biogenesis protein PilO [Vicinamibacterales bacterium]|nr:type 4a pilus biogenesis protein PilO [Vicinamibacterales bacterium]
MSLWRRVMAERKGLVLPLLIALAINIGVLALGVFPLRASVAGDENRAKAVKAQLIEAQRLERLANDTRASQVRADQELKQFYSEVLPGSHAAAQNLLYLQLRIIARQNGVAFATGNFENEPVDDSPLMRLGSNVSLNGDYSNIRRFLYDLETAEEFFVVENMKLGPSSRKDSGALEVVVAVATYYMGTRR